MDRVMLLQKDKLMKIFFPIINVAAVQCGCLRM
jgi:hypothetical protein